MTEREAFEAWALSAGWPHGAVNADRSNYYSSQSWEAWQAARAQPAQAVPMTDTEIDALLPEPDGSAETDTVDVEVSPGLWGKEYSEADAWSKPLVVQAIRAAERHHGIVGKEDA